MSAVTLPLISTMDFSDWGPFAKSSLTMLRTSRFDHGNLSTAIAIDEDRDRQDRECGKRYPAFDERSAGQQLAAQATLHALYN
jgi:hypothetical protein